LTRDARPAGDARVAEKRKARPRKIARLEHEHAGQKIVFQQAADVRQARTGKGRAEKEKQLAVKYSDRWQALETEWKTKTLAIYAEISAAQTAATKLFPDWQSLKQWTPPPRFAHAVKFGGLDVDVKKISGALPRSERLALPARHNSAFPLTLTFPQQGSVLFETKNFRARRNHRDTQRHHSPVVVYRAGRGARSFTIIEGPSQLGKFRRRHAPCRLRSASDHNRHLDLRELRSRKHSRTSTSTSRR